MKISLKKNWLSRLIQDLSPTGSGACKGIVCNGITKYGYLDQFPQTVTVIWYVTDATVKFPY